VFIDKPSNFVQHKKADNAKYVDRTSSIPCRFVDVSLGSYATLQTKHRKMSYDASQALLSAM
jgi:hypothetical protein